MYCEAMIKINGRYHVCRNGPAHKHHKLTRARGGRILDAAGETYHLMWLCPEHHTYAHGNPHAYDAGLLLRGLVVSDSEGKPVYEGPDEYLSEKYS
jgi:hypothetical protein